MSLASPHPVSLVNEPFTCAVRYLEAHQSQHLDDDQLIKRCVSHLIATMGITQATAENNAMHALADLQARHVPAYFDTSGSTSYVVRVVDPRSGEVYALTATDVLQCAKAWHNAQPDTTHCIQQCGRSAQLN
ncbi:hypothetical protein [Dyella sp. ASV21]|uniref:hypothetical protein n=1 Tax=Dyella sp. ASV21 TaxID=2795114 RepID=UPI0018EAC427|nr:hypothetical protein [Dyella sp. ASV21]